MPDLDEVADDVPSPEALGLLRRNAENTAYDQVQVVETDFTATPPPNGTLLGIQAGKVQDRTAAQARSDMNVWEKGPSGSTVGDGVTVDAAGRLEPVEVTSTDIDSATAYTAGVPYRGTGTALGNVDQAGRLVRVANSVTSGAPSVSGAYEGDMALVRDAAGWYWALKLVTDWLDMGPGPNPSRVVAEGDAIQALTGSPASVVWNSTPVANTNWTYDGTDEAWVCPQDGTYTVRVALQAGLNVTGREQVTSLLYYDTDGASGYSVTPGNYRTSCTVGDDTAATEGKNTICMETEISLEVGGKVRLQAFGTSTDCRVIAGTGETSISITRIR